MKGKTLWAILALVSVSGAEKEVSDIDCHLYGVTKKQEAWITRFCREIDVREGRL